MTSAAILSQQLRDKRAIDISKVCEDNEDCTVVLIVEGKRFHVHKCVLVETSQYFQSMFNGNFMEATRKEVQLPLLRKDDLEFVLNYVNGAVIDFEMCSVEKLLELYHLANMLCMDSLVAEFREFIANTKSFEDSERWYNHAKAFDDVDAVNGITGLFLKRLVTYLCTKSIVPNTVSMVTNGNDSLDNAPNELILDVLKIIKIPEDTVKYGVLKHFVDMMRHWFFTQEKIKILSDWVESESHEDTSFVKRVELFDHTGWEQLSGEKLNGVLMMFLQEKRLKSFNALTVSIRKIHQQMAVNNLRAAWVKVRGFEVTLSEYKPRSFREPPTWRQVQHSFPSEISKFVVDEEKFYFLTVENCLYVMEVTTTSYNVEMYQIETPRNFVCSKLLAKNGMVYLYGKNTATTAVVIMTYDKQCNEATIHELNLKFYDKWLPTLIVEDHRVIFKNRRNVFECDLEKKSVTVIFAINKLCPNFNEDTHLAKVGEDIYLFNDKGKYLVYPGFETRSINSVKFNHEKTSICSAVEQGLIVGILPKTEQPCDVTLFRRVDGHFESLGRLPGPDFGPHCEPEEKCEFFMRCVKTISATREN